MAGMALPLRKSRKPRHNAPVWASTSTTGIVGLVLALQAEDIPTAVIVAVVVTSMVLGFVGGLFAQGQTNPTDDTSTAATGEPG